MVLPRHTFASIKSADDPYRFALEVEPELCAWGAGRHFLMGGVGVGATLDAMSAVVGQPLIASSTQFMSFATVGEVLEVAVEVLVEGRTVTQARATVSSPERLVLATTAALGLRESQPHVTFDQMPDVPPPDQCPLRPAQWEAIASIHDRLEQRQVRADDVTATGRAQQWMRPLAGGASIPGCIAVVADHLPGVTHSAFETENNTNSLDNTIRFHDLVDSDWLLLDQQLTAIGNGSFHAEGRLFSEDGRLVASVGQSGIIRFPSA